MMRNALFPCPQLFIRFHTFIRKGEFWKTFSSLSPTSEVSFTNSSMRSPSSLFCSDTCVAEVESFFSSSLFRHLSRVDFPAPLVPRKPHASPFFISRLMSFNAMNSWNINCFVTSLIKYSFRLSTFRLFLLNLMVTSLSSIMVSPFATVVVRCAFEVKIFLSSSSFFFSSTLANCHTS